MSRVLTRRGFLQASGSALAASVAAPRPNILVILADDLGIGDLGCYGQQKIATPNLDRMAAEGMRFQDAYAGAAVCAPSRCVLMTGLDAGHARIRDNHNHRGERVPLRPEDLTVAELLKGAGYRTALIGKWGLGEAGTTGTPLRQGFDEFYGFLNQDHAAVFYPHHIWDNESEVFLEGNLGILRKHFAHDLLTSRALEFLRRRGRLVVNSDGLAYLGECPSDLPLLCHGGVWHLQAREPVAREIGNGRLVARSLEDAELRESTLQEVDVEPWLHIAADGTQTMQVVLERHHGDTPVPDGRPPNLAAFANQQIAGFQTLVG